MTTYEKTKWEAEKIVFQGIDDCSVIILRPTNIVDTNNIGVLDAVVSTKVLDRLTIIVRGGECAHVVHAKDVANAAVFFNELTYKKPVCFFVSRDEDRINTFIGMRKIYHAVVNKKPVDFKGDARTVPLFIPHILRMVRVGKKNWGDVRYTSNTISKAGYTFLYDTKSAVSEILSQTLGLKTSPLANRDLLSANRTIVVVGASGFIGRNLIRELSGFKNLKVRAVIQREENLDLFKNLPNVEVMKGTLLRRETLKGLILPGCTVINLAFMENATQAQNLLAIRTLADLCKQQGIKRLVHCSTATVIGDAEALCIDEDTEAQAKTEYDICKLKIEKYLFEHASGNYELAILRPTAVFGEGGENLVKLAEQLVKDNWILNYLRSSLLGTRKMNLVCLKNVLGALLFLCDDALKLQREIFIISDDNYPKNNYKEIEKSLMKRLRIKPYPIPQILVPGFVLRFLLRLLNKPIKQTERKFSSEKLARAGFRKTITFQEELNNFTKWYTKTAESKTAK